MTGIAGAGSRDPVLWETWRGRIVADREQQGHYSCALILGAATRFGRDTRTIRHWLEDDPRHREIFELNDEQMAYIRWKGGNLHEAWKALAKDGLISVSEKTFRRAFARLPNGTQKGLREGLRAMRTALPWVALPAPTRPNEIWEIDHALLEEIVIRDPHTNRRGHPWITLIIDVYTRLIVGFSITLAFAREGGRRGSPTSESGFAALADAMLGRDYGGTFVGGKPEWVRIDQGKDFMNPVADALDRLGVEVDPVAAETPQHKPHVERFIGTLKRKYLPTLPGWGEELEAIA